MDPFKLLKFLHNLKVNIYMDTLTITDITISYLKCLENMSYSSTITIIQTTCWAIIITPLKTTVMRLFMKCIIILSSSTMVRQLILQQ